MSEKISSKQTEHDGIKRMFIMQGFPGSGKTTWVRKHQAANSSKSHILAVDKYTKRLEGSQYVYSLDDSKDARSECFLDAIKHCQLATDTIYIDGTNAYPEVVAPYMLLGEAHGYIVEIIYIKADVVAYVARNAHDVPFKTIQACAWALETFKPPLHWPIRRTIDTDSF